MTTRVAGCDLGKATARFVTGTVDRDGRLALDPPLRVPHEGRPFETFRRWYKEHEIADCAVLGATGAYASELSDPVLVLPEDSCQEAALAGVDAAPESLNLVSVGARGYSVLTAERAADGSFRTRFAENDKCSSGSGENLERLATRFGLTLPQADELAAGAERAIPITARCSVFAKSELTHYANQGKPAAELFRGTFEAVARNTWSLLRRNAVDGPVFLIGGCSRIGSLRRALDDLLGEETVVLGDHDAFEALGAARIAAEHMSSASAALPEDGAELIRWREARFEVLAPASRWREQVTHLEAPATGESWEQEPTVLGLDLGSTGAKAALTSLRTGELLFERYDRTRGNPVDASRRLVRAILEQGKPDVRAVGLTGSGREAVSTLLGAVFDEPGRVLVQNEIVAHAKAAVRCDPDGGRDLSVVEIGGQDAKYIRVEAGRIVESDMNRACSAGTGSFLEEQAAFYDVHDISRFTELATSAERPPDLGQMCTVYVAEAGAEALKDGFGLADIFAGFQYSVIHNYLHRVMGQRTLAERVFFQGKPASNPSLAWTLAAITGREIFVPPNPGAMGAWGIGLCAIDELDAASLAAAPPLDLDALLRAEIVGRSEFQCRDKACQTVCPIEKTTISVGGRTSVALSGGACPKFEVTSQSAPKLEKGAPDPFAARAALVDGFARERPGRREVGVPVTGPIVGLVPWVTTLLEELGLSVRLLRPTASSLAEGEGLCGSFDSCGPTKIAHALCDTDVDTLFFPAVAKLPSRGRLGGEPCVTEQAMPDIVAGVLAGRGSAVEVIRPRLSFHAGYGDHELGGSLLPALKQLGVSPLALPRAICRAARAQRAFEARLTELGDEALAWARERSVPAVVLCGPLHVIHDPAANAKIPDLLRRNGAMAIPMDCFRVGESPPLLKKIYWAEHNRYLQAAAVARAAGDVFPVMLSSFGCGPASFTEQLFQAAMKGYPHTVLESDGHGGTAGFVTRIQSFLCSVRQGAVSDGEPSTALESAESAPRTGSYLDRDVRYVFLSSIDYLGPLLAAVYRSYGYEADAAPPLSAESFALGRADCSGKECLSYQMIWGAFRRYLEEHPPSPDRETRLVQISGESCRAGAFGIKDRLTLDTLGLDGRIGITSLRIAGGPGMSSKLWAGLVAVDILRQLYLYHLPAAPDDAESLYHRFAERVVSLLERPAERGWLPSKAAATRRDWRQLEALVTEAARAFAALPAADEERTRTVFVSGDLMTKGNDFANGGVYQLLASRGVRAVPEGACDFLEFLARVHPHLFFGRDAGLATRAVYVANMGLIRRRLCGIARELHPWLPEPDVTASIARTGEMLKLKTNGGCGLAVGSVLHHWDLGGYDGVVMTACWGCDNGLVEESLLRQRRDIPLYFHYDDATPIDERRLMSFAFRLQRSPRRGAATPGHRVRASSASASRS